MQKQVEKSHYEFSRYVQKKRWVSIWHQLDEILKLEPQRVLEIGPGPGVFKAVAHNFGINIETLDLDPELNPDHVASALDMPFPDREFDVTCAFQMLEHLPFEKSLVAFAEMVRVARRAIVISLPDAATRWPVSIHVPKLGVINFSFPKLRIRAPVHEFDGEHYWEINKAGYTLTEVKEAFCAAAPVILSRTYRVPELPYHRFFIFTKISD